MDFHVEFHHLIDVEWFHTPTNRHAQGVTDEVADVMIFQKRRIFGENLALGGIFDVRFQSNQSIFSGTVKQVVHHLQRFQISLLGEFGAAQNHTQAASDLFQNMQWVGDEQSTDGCAGNDDQFGGLNEHFDVAVLHQVPGYDRGEDHQDSNNCEHNDSLSESYPLPYEGGSLSAFVLQNLNLLPNFVA